MAPPGISRLDGSAAAARMPVNARALPAATRPVAPVTRVGPQTSSFTPNTNTTKPELHNPSTRLAQGLYFQLLAQHNAILAQNLLAQLLLGTSRISNLAAQIGLFTQRPIPLATTAPLTSLQHLLHQPSGSAQILPWTFLAPEATATSPNAAEASPTESHPTAAASSTGAEVASTPTTASDLSGATTARTRSTPVKFIQNIPVFTLAPLQTKLDPTTQALTARFPVFITQQPASIGTSAISITSSQGPIKVSSLINAGWSITRASSASGLILSDRTGSQVLIQSGGHTATIISGDLNTAIRLGHAIQATQAAINEPVAPAEPSQIRLDGELKAVVDPEPQPAGLQGTDTSSTPTTLFETTHLTQGSGTITRSATATVSSLGLNTAGAIANTATEAQSQQLSITVAGHTVELRTPLLNALQIQSVHAEIHTWAERGLSVHEIATNASLMIQAMAGAAAAKAYLPRYH